MVLKQEESINRYFEHAMTSGEEQNFLISLAASDQMRIAFRSHLELMKAVRDDKDRLRSVAQVRTRTLTALGLSAAAVTPFIEQELVRSSREATQAASIGGVGVKAGLVSGLLRTPKYALASGVLLGFLGSVAIMNLGSGVIPNHTAAVPAAQQVPATQQSPAANRQTETIPAANGLNTVAEKASRPSSDRTSASHPITGEATGHNRAVNASGKLPEVSLSGPARMHVNKATIKQAGDSVKAP